MILLLLKIFFSVSEVIVLLKTAKNDIHSLILSSHRGLKSRRQLNDLKSVVPDCVYVKSTSTSISEGPQSCGARRLTY